MITIFVPEINIYTPIWEWPKWMRKQKSVIASFVGGPGADAPVVDFTSTNVSTSRDPAICIANVKWDSDGSAYASDNEGNYGAADETWLTSGNAADVWIDRTILSGTLTTDGIGTGRAQLSSDRIIGVSETSGTKSCNGEVEFWDAASGGNSLDTGTWSCTADGDGGPPP